MGGIVCDRVSPHGTRSSNKKQQQAAASSAASNNLKEDIFDGVDPCASERPNPTVEVTNLNAAAAVAAARTPEQEEEQESEDEFEDTNQENTNQENKEQDNMVKWDDVIIDSKKDGDKGVSKKLHLIVSTELPKFSKRNVTADKGRTVITLNNIRNAAILWYEKAMKYKKHIAHLESLYKKEIARLEQEKARLESQIQDLNGEIGTIRIENKKTIFIKFAQAHLRNNSLLFIALCNAGFLTYIPYKKITPEDLVTEKIDLEHDFTKFVFDSLFKELEQSPTVPSKMSDYRELYTKGQRSQFNTEHHKRLLWFSDLGLGKLSLSLLNVKRNAFTYQLRQLFGKRSIVLLLEIYSFVLLFFF